MSKVIVHQLTIVFLLLTTQAGLAAIDEPNRISPTVKKIAKKVSFGNDPLVLITSDSNTFFRVLIEVRSTSDSMSVIVQQVDSGDNRAKNINLQRRNDTENFYGLSHRMRGGGELTITAPSNADRVVVEKILYFGEAPDIRSAVDTRANSGEAVKPNYRPLRPLESNARSSTVLLLLIGRNGAVPCSGFFVSSRLLLTAAHCFSDVRDPILVGWRNASTLEEIREPPDIVNASLRLKHVARDIAFIQVAARDANSTFLKLNEQPINLDEDRELVVIQHPGGSLLVANDDIDCQIVSHRQPHLLGHQCDTDFGSSGSPIFLRGTYSNVVAMHRVGHEGIGEVNYAIPAESVLETLDSLAVDTSDSERQSAAKNILNQLNQ